jgi:hypothetical protein
MGQKGGNAKIMIYLPSIRHLVEDMTERRALSKASETQRKNSLKITH